MNTETQNNKVTLKDVCHLYIGQQVRIWNTVTNQWGNYRRMSFRDAELIVTHGVRAELILNSLSEMTEEEGTEYSKLVTRHLKHIVGEVQAVSNAKSTMYLLSRGFDLFDLLDSGEAVPF
jgi:hypothetical protein